MITKFLIIFVMAFLFGIERQMSNKPIGFGTFIFVATGACALGELTLSISPGDSLAIIGGVVTGIGFLGAGALIKTTDRIFGFTTAASIWIFSIIGLNIGLGQYAIASATYTIVWLVIAIDITLEKNGIGSYQKKVTVITKRIIKKEEITSIFQKYKWKLLKLEVDKKNKKDTIVYLVNMPRKYIETLKEKMESKEWIENFNIE